MDALELLTADHNRVRGLFNRFKAAEGENDAQAARLAATIFTELEIHTKIEEEIFYPTITKLNDEIHDTVTEGIEEHHVVDTLMAEAKGMDPSDEAWAAKIKVLIENVEHHADEEEEDMFPMVRKAMDADTRAALGQQLEARKAALGAPTAADKAHLSTEELNRLAREQEIPGRSNMKHAKSCWPRSLPRAEPPRRGPSPLASPQGVTWSRHYLGTGQSQRHTPDDGGSRTDGNECQQVIRGKYLGIRARRNNG